MNVRLRALKANDAVFMLEWMHTSSVVENLNVDFMSKTMKDCEKFIYTSLESDNNLHLAIADQDDIYQGTVSLKNIHDKTAEFAIVIRESAMGKDIAKYAMEQILYIGFAEKKLSLIYWYVSFKNKRALRFYEKNNYKRIPSNKLEFIQIGDNDNCSCEWFCITYEEWMMRKVN